MSTLHKRDEKNYKALAKDKRQDKRLEINTPT